MIKSYTAATSGWNQAVANLEAPPGATSAQIWLVARSLKGTIYVDAFTFQPGAAALPAGAALPATATSGFDFALPEP